MLSTGQGVLGHNRYAYCGNNSVARADNCGSCWEDIWEWIQSVFFGGNCSGTKTEQLTVVEISIPPVDTPRSTAVPISEYYIDQVLNRAESFVGTPYGRDPGQMDCSLFVQTVYLPYDSHFTDTGKRQKKYILNEGSKLWDYYGIDEAFNLSSIPRGAVIFYSYKMRASYDSDEAFYKVRHVAIAAGNNMMYDSTNKEDINGVSKRSIFDSLTHHDRTIIPTGYAVYTGWE